MINTILSIYADPSFGTFQVAANVQVDDVQIYDVNDGLVSTDCLGTNNLIKSKLGQDTWSIIRVEDVTTDMTASDISGLINCLASPAVSTNAAESEIGLYFTNWHYSGS